MRDEPYFITNEEWWYYDIESGTIKLTDKAPQDAIDSYNKFYAPQGDDGEVVDA